jgi:nucleotide-binding universal stress UspA family protein
MSANEFPDPIDNEAEPRRVFRQILVAVDESRQAGWAADLAIRLAEVHDARLILLHVVVLAPSRPEFAYIEPTEPGGYLRDSELMLERAKAAVPRTIPVDTVLREGDPATEILEAAQVFDADLIVMGTHGRGPIGRVVLGSVASAVMRKSACPVLTVTHAPPGSDNAIGAAALTAATGVA